MAFSVTSKMKIVNINYDICGQIPPITPNILTVSLTNFDISNNLADADGYARLTISRQPLFGFS